MKREPPCTLLALRQEDIFFQPIFALSQSASNVYAKANCQECCRPNTSIKRNSSQVFLVEHKSLAV